jgi:hypothetical protein
MLEAADLDKTRSLIEDAPERLQRRAEVDMSGWHASAFVR